MVVCVRLHGWLKSRCAAPGGVVELELPDGASVGQAIEALQSVAALPDRPACMAVAGGTRAPLGTRLVAGQVLDLYPMTSGG